jgi:hypothetical protein
VVRHARESPLPSTLVRRATAATVLAVTAVALVTVGCSSDDRAATTTTTAASSSTSPAPTQGPGTTGASATVASSAPVGVNPLPAVRAGVPVPILHGVTVSLTGTKAVDVTARGPGETSGPAVAATFEIRNGGAVPFSLAGVAVNATDRGGAPAESASASPAEPFTGSLPPGWRATGVYVFRVPRAGTELILDVQSDAAADVPRFRT